MKTKNINPDFKNDLGKIFKDLMVIKIKPTDSFKSSLDKFYAVMRKWEIKQGTWTESGSRLCCTPEWVMCYDVFKQHKISTLDIWLILNEPPKDLLAYGKKPINKTSKIKKTKAFNSFYEFEKFYFPEKHKQEKLAKLSPEQLGKHLAKESIGKLKRNMK